MWAPSLPAQKRWLGFCESRLRGLVHAIDNAGYSSPDDVRAYPYAEIFAWTRPATNGHAAATSTTSGGGDDDPQSHTGQAAAAAAAAAAGPHSGGATTAVAAEAAAPLEHVSSFFLALSFAAGLSHFDLTHCTRDWVEKVNFWGGRTPGEKETREGKKY